MTVLTRIRACEDCGTEQAEASDDVCWMCGGPAPVVSTPAWLGAASRQPQPIGSE